MLPVFTSPLGSKKEMFSSLSTSYCLRASANEPDLEALVPLVVTMPFKAAEAEAAAAFFERTRSAQDLGAALEGGEATGNASAGFESVAASVGGAGGAVAADAAGLAVRCAAAVAASEDAGLGLERGRVGTTGTMGTAVLVFLLPFVCGEVDCSASTVFSVWWLAWAKGSTADGASVSEGVCEVAGVSLSRDEGMVEASD